MTLSPNSMFRLLASVSLSLTLCAGATAQGAFPQRPVTVVVPYLPGGTPDILARIVGPELTKRWGQPVIIENRAGANGAIGSGVVAKAKPDGYTLVMGTTATHVINGQLYSTMPYDGIADFAPIAMLGTLSNVLVVNPKIPATNVTELIALLKKDPDAYTYGSGGNGSSNHLAAEMFKTMAGVSMMHVPYKSAAPAMVGLLGGETSMIFENVSTALPHIQSGALRPLGVTSANGTAALPDVPTIDAAGVPGYDMAFWYGLLAPAGTPPEVIQKVNTDVMDVLALPSIAKQLKDRGIDMQPNTPAEFAAVMQAEVPKWTQVVKASGARID
ncbi:MAG: tripartite tricarboxylate transporter substrate binding protein [Rubrivivax sp.]|nr:MAG: tripartite tricarboxylate transporter substrate binding protein [Rubrivivax sp.]